MSRPLPDHCQDPACSFCQERRRRRAAQAQAVPADHWGRPIIRGGVDALGYWDGTTIPNTNNL